MGDAAQEAVPPLLEVLAGFLSAYLVVLAVPGPNMAAIAGIAAIQGVGGAVPACAGIAAGAGTLAGVVALMAGTGEFLSGQRLAGAVRSAGCVLLLLVAWHILRPALHPGAPCPSALARSGGLAAFGAGFLVSATNPITASFFAGYLLGRQQGGAFLAAVPLAVLPTAFLFFLAVGGALSHPRLMGAMAARQRGARAVAAALIAGAALVQFRAVLAG